MLDINRIRYSFTKAAALYEKNAFLQRRIGSDLISRIRNKAISPEKILDIGMGTGWLTDELSKVYKSDVFGIDSAWGMVRRAKLNPDLKVVLADARGLPFKDKTFDLIVSNLTFQWVYDLDVAFPESFRVLRPEAFFYFTGFGKETLKELRLSFNSILGREYFSSRFGLPEEDKISLALKQAGFKNIYLNKKIYCEHFPDLFSLMRWLKIIGANCLNRPRFISRKIFYRVNDFYQSNFRDNGSIIASFDCIEARMQK